MRHLDCYPIAFSFNNHLQMALTVYFQTPIPKVNKQDLLCKQNEIQIMKQFRYY